MDQQKVRRILLPLVGVALTGICVGVFKFAAFGVDPYQSFMSGMDALVPIPFGTLATAFALGPLIDWFNRKVSGPLLHGKRASRGV